MNFAGGCLKYRQIIKQNRTFVIWIYNFRNIALIIFIELFINNINLFKMVATVISFFTYDFAVLIKTISYHKWVFDFFAVFF